MTLKNIVLTVAATTTGVNAGLFFAYQVSIIPAFKTLSDRDYIAAMQAINAAIQNPVFLSNFLGTVFFLPAAAYLHRSKPASLRSKLLLGATLLYIVGTFGITADANVPLNDMLAQFSLHSSTPQQVAKVRAGFEGPWNTWHLMRTIASVGSLVLVIAACLSASTVSSRPSKRNN